MPILTNIKDKNGYQLACEIHPKNATVVLITSTTLQLNISETYYIFGICLGRACSFITGVIKPSRTSRH